MHYAVVYGIYHNASGRVLLCQIINGLKMCPLRCCFLTQIIAKSKTRLSTKVYFYCVNLSYGECVEIHSSLTHYTECVSWYNIFKKIYKF